MKLLIVLFLCYNSTVNKTIQINNQVIELWFGTDGRLGKGQNKVLEKHGVKFCSRCQSVKEISKFHVVKQVTRPYCQDCTRAAGREQIRRRYHRIKNGIKQKRFKFKNHLAEISGGECCICGYNKFVTALEYHHVKKKSFNVFASALNILTTRNEKRLEHAKMLSDELTKCVLVCANCHSAIHGKQITISESIMKNKLILVSPYNIMHLASWTESDKHVSLLNEAMITN